MHNAQPRRCVKNYGSWEAAGGPKDPLADPVSAGIADAHGRTATQVILRWHVQHGGVAIPRSSMPAGSRRTSTFFDFALSDAEMARIDAFDTGRRAGPDPVEIDADSFSE